MHTFFSLFIFLFISPTKVDTACTNSMGDAACGAKLEVANFCYLDKLTRCRCKKACDARPDCLNPTDSDNACDCMFNALLCENPDQPWFSTYCPTTCSRRSSLTCDPLIKVEGASPLFNGLEPKYPLPKFMDKVTFRCNLGFKQTSGPPELALWRVCINDGTWILHPDYQNPPLVCESVVCGVPPAVTNAIASVSSGLYSTTTTYSCLAGFEKTGGGNGHKMCDATGVWSPVAFDQDIICTAKPCSAIPTVPSAVPSIASGSYRDQVTYSCATGYAQTGGQDGRRSCTVAGTWYKDRSDPVCTRISCGSPPDVIGASPSTSTGYFPGNVTYVCKSTYDNVGGGTGLMACNASGLWEASSSNDPAPLCLGKFVKFVNSAREVHAAPPGSMTSQSARSALHCASMCAASILCHGYTFSHHLNLCEMNTAFRLPVLTLMKKYYE